MKQLQNICPGSIEIPTQIKNSKLVLQRRKQLVKAATRIFMKKGYDKTTIRDISREAKLSMGNLYNYINKKEDVLYLVHEDMVHSFYQKMFDHVKAKNEFNNEEKLQGIIQNALERSFVFCDEILLLYRETGSLSHQLIKSILRIETEYINMLKNLLDEANKRRVVKIEDTYFVANLIVYLLSFFPLRNWNLNAYDRPTFIKLLMHYINQILKSSPIKSKRLTHGHGRQNHEDQ
jgi:AcrR family transcriptional regulator